ncbi:hypothetical protein QA802_39740 [Streptomyces sp. B21-105]|uniref:hypothetical protein n=1 Tax=Streptomyces sp. B21-105 TaxID=3039417 RepID=UPI002FEF6BF1
MTKRRSAIERGSVARSFTWSIRASATSRRKATVAYAVLPSSLICPLPTGV